MCPTILCGAFLDHMRLLSPAKLNLFFRVLGKRFDGFHEIASMIGVINLFDEIEIDFASQDALHCSDSTIPTGGDNLVWKAVSKFRSETGLSAPISIKLNKRIPVEAGLGGGSSNAATTLWGLNQLLGAPLSEGDLIKLSWQIGSDVALFFSSGTAFCRGRGERISNRPSISIPNLFVAKPTHLCLSTPKVYGLCRPTPSSEDRLNELVDGYSSGDFQFFNDLETAALTLQPELNSIKQSLFSLGFKDVVMTGSGTAFFCIGEPNHLKLNGIDFFQVKLLERKEMGWWSESKNFKETPGFVSLESQNRNNGINECENF